MNKYIIHSIVYFLLLIVLVVFIYTVGVLVLVVVWNDVFASIFNISKITFWQGFLIMLLFAFISNLFNNKK